MCVVFCKEKEEEKGLASFCVLYGSRHTRNTEWNKTIDVN